MASSTGLILTFNFWLIKIDILFIAIEILLLYSGVDLRVGFSGGGGCESRPSLKVL